MNYPHITEYLTYLQPIKPLPLNLFIKENMKEQFKHVFLKESGNKFLLWTKQKVLDMHLLGKGKNTHLSRICLEITLRSQSMLCPYIIKVKRPSILSVSMQV